MKKFFTLVALAFSAISMSAQESAIYAWQDDFEANNTITFADGAKIQITGNTRFFSLRNCNRPACDYRLRHFIKGCRPD